MSLIIYSNKHKPPKDTNIITKNDVYLMVLQILVEVRLNL